MHAPLLDPGSNPGGIVASGHAWTLGAVGVCAEVHQTIDYHSNHQSD